MSKSATLLLAGMVVAGVASTGQAFWFGHAAAGCGAACQSRTGADPLDYCLNGCEENSKWPSQYLCPDRVHAHAPFDTMVRNGWRRQNLLGAHHFNEDASRLTQAGELKVRWIMTQAPPQYRRIFVEQALKTETTEQRIATANQFAEAAAFGQQVPQVATTHIVSEGRPAATVDYVNTQFRENMKVPVLPTTSLGGGGAGQ
ncbi:MAG: hypothetical protein AAGJ46_21000 [Planctomycetota bacterium]